jgi:proteic killer suppression protein
LRLTQNGDILFLQENDERMIKSYKCRETQHLKATGESWRFRAFERIALRKLDMLEAAVNVESLRIPPGNRLEALHGKREGQYSIRINDQWRICFTWHEGNAYNVEIVDYH